MTGLPLFVIICCFIAAHNKQYSYENISETIEIESDDKTEYVYNLQYINYEESDDKSKEDAELKYYNTIKQYLDIGIPVEICIRRKQKDGTYGTHYITIIGYKGDCTSLDDLLMADPATSDKDKKVNYVTSSYDELYKYNGDYSKYGLHLVTPNIIINNTEYVLDENGNIIDIFKRKENGDIKHNKLGWIEYLDEPKVIYRKKVTDDGSVYYLDDSGNIFSINNGIPVSTYKYSDGELMPYDLYKYIKSILDIYPSSVSDKAIAKEIILGKTGRRINYDECERIVKAFEDESIVLGSTVTAAVTYAKSNVTTASVTRYDPLILDLDGDGYNVEAKENGTNFDLDKNNFAEKINWTKKDGFLCLDFVCQYQASCTHKYLHSVLGKNCRGKQQNWHN